MARRSKPSVLTVLFDEDKNVCGAYVSERNGYRSPSGMFKAIEFSSKGDAEQVKSAIEDHLSEVEGLHEQIYRLEEKIERKKSNIKSSLKRDYQGQQLDSNGRGSQISSEELDEKLGNFLEKIESRLQ